MTFDCADIVSHHHQTVFSYTIKFFQKPKNGEKMVRDRLFGTYLLELICPITV